MKTLERIPALLLCTVLLTGLCGCGCKHEWVEATCTEPQTCSICGETNGEALGHDWQAATCTEAKTCAVCGETEGEPLGHDWQAATCTAPETCVVCGETQGNATGHTVSEWTVTKTAGYDESGEKTGLCAVCGETVTESYSLSAEERESYLRNNCGSYSYDEIARNPGSYEGKYAKFTGKVIQVQQSELYGILAYVMRVNVTKTRYSYTDTVYVTYYAAQDDTRILEDDIITMYGELTGEKTYTTVMGASVTIPSFTASYVDIKG